MTQIDQSNSSSPDLATVSELARRFPSAFTEPSLRYLIQNAHANGLEPAIVRIGRRVLIRVPEFIKWLTSQHEGNKNGKIK